MRSVWELGVGLFSLYLNDYRGSDQSSYYFIPYPSLIYRGKNIRAKNGFLEGDLYQWGPFRLDISMSASLRVNAVKNKAREGMPSLDATFEIGPALEWRVWQSQDNKNNFSFVLPLRKVTSVDFWRIGDVGYFTVPYIAYWMHPQKLTLDLFFTTTFALLFGDQRYHSYFYQVRPEYQTRNRAAYTPGAGYSGYHGTVFVSKRISQLYIFSFCRYDNIKNSAFYKSPLVKIEHYWAMGLGFMWHFFQSEKKRRISRNMD